MKQIILSLVTLSLSICVFSSCSKDEVEEMKETGEILINTYVDGEYQNSTRATVQLNGGYATGAGKYKYNTIVPVEAVANTGYELESFIGGENNKFKGLSKYDVTVDQPSITLTAKFKQKPPVGTNVSLTINFIDKTAINLFEHMWVDVTVNGSKSTVELDLRTGGWSSIYVANVSSGSTFTLSNFRSHYVASGTSSEARNIFNSTNNFGVVYCNEKSGSFGTSSTISGTLNSNTTYNFYID